jgi:galactokinase
VTTWLSRATRIGLSAEAAALAARHFADVESHFARTFGDTGRAQAWWIPGRIEVLGKHTDYGGGRSLLCAVERGFHLLAAPRDDGLVHMVDSSTRASLTVRLDRDCESRPGHWTDYPISVIRRVARDFPGASRGMSAVLRSSLPSASGLSSSSALVIASFLSLAAFNHLRDRPEWQAIPNDDHLAEYLGAMENGRAYGPFPADRGVGTQGGSEDQTAILRSVPGHLLQYHFVPVTAEAVLPLPVGWCFVIAMSGVHAAKGAAVQGRYNALAAEMAELVALWNGATGRGDRSLLAALESSASAQADLDRVLGDLGDDRATPLQRRLAQFADESVEIIPEVARALRAGAVAAIGPLVDRSQQGAIDALHNQIPETVHLAGRARFLGAVAASAFGAGFGGSVWALVRDEDLSHFRTAWRDDFLAAFPQRRQRAEFFVSRPGPAATTL